MSVSAAPDIGEVQQARPGCVSLLTAFVAGAAYLVLTLPRGATSLSSHNGWGWLEGPANLSSTVNHVLPPFNGIINFLICALVVYVILLGILAIRHGTIGIFGWGVFTLAVSTVILHLLAWIGFIAFTVVHFVYRLIGSIFSFLNDWGAAVREWFSELISQATTYGYATLGSTWWLYLIGALLVIGLGAVKGKGIIRGVARFIAFAIAIIAALYLITLVLKLLIEFVAPVIPYVLGTVAALFAILVIGQLLFDQVKSSLKSGNQKLGVILGAIGSGTVLALLLLESDIYDSYSWYPSSIAGIANEYVHQDSPRFDASFAALIISLCVIGVLRNIPKFLPEPSVEEFGRSAVYNAVGVIVGGALLGAGQITEN